MAFNQDHYFKLENVKVENADVNESKNKPSFPAYRIIETATVFQTLSSLMICKKCHGDIRFEEEDNAGLGFKIVVKCSCGDRNIPSCPKVPVNDYEINRRLVFSMRMCGQGLNAINLFCNLMDLGKGLNVNAYKTICALINSSAKKMFEISSRKAVEIEKTEMEKLQKPHYELQVSGYGQTWKKRGNETLFGVMPLTTYHSGKIIDLVVMSCSCQECRMLKNLVQVKDENIKWCFEHLEICEKFQEVSTENVEAQAIRHMFISSTEKFGVKYREYDGNKETCDEIAQFKPYGEECPVKKFEGNAYDRKTYESLHATIWRLDAKNSHSGKESVESAAYIAAGIFNDGFAAIADIMSDLEINISPQMRQYVEAVDTGRRRSSLMPKEEDEAEELCKRAEGLLYTPKFAD